MSALTGIFALFSLASLALIPYVLLVLWHITEHEHHAGWKQYVTTPAAATVLAAWGIFNLVEDALVYAGAWPSGGEPSWLTMLFAVVHLWLVYEALDARKCRLARRAVLSRRYPVFEKALV